MERFPSRIPIWARRCIDVLMVLFFLFIPIKLSFVYAVSIPSIILWAIVEYRSVFAKITQNRLVVPLVFFLLVSLLSSLFGLNPRASLAHLGSFAFLVLLIPCVSDSVVRQGVRTPLFALLTGQAVAAFDTILEHLPLLPLPQKFFPGAVTESGQLGMSVLVALGLLIHHTLEDPHRHQLASRVLKAVLPFASGALFLALSISLAFGPVIGLNPERLDIVFAAWAIFTAAIITIVVKLRAPRLRSELTLRLILLPALLSALVINLKRGPWAGVVIGSMLLTLLFARRIIPLLLIVGACLLIFVHPVQQRLRQSYADFSIAGGRSVIWEIGSELALKYPLGIGYSNSGFLRKFSSDIPSDLKHFHNNAINVVVETGWIGLGTFLWWLIAIIRQAFSRSLNAGHRSPLGCALGAALIAWQVGGLVEYNFGDSEVLILALALTGVISGMHASRIEA